MLKIQQLTLPVIKCLKDSDLPLAKPRTLSHLPHTASQDTAELALECVCDQQISPKLYRKLCDINGIRPPGNGSGW